MAKIVRTRTHVKRSVTTPFGCGIRAGKPKADRATTKRKATSYLLPTPFGGWYRTPSGSCRSTPVGCAHRHMGDLKVSPCAPGPKVPVKKKKKLGLG